MTTPNLMLTEVPQAILGASDELNESLWAIDAILQLSVDSRVTALPATATQGTRYIIPSGPRANHVAYMTPQGWRYFVPRRGWKTDVRDEDTTLKFTGTQWEEDASGGAPGSVNQHKFTWVRGGGSAIAVPIIDIPAAYFPVGAEITGAVILTQGGPGSCEIDLWKTPIGSFPADVGDSICNGSEAVLSTDQAGIVDVSAWDLAIAAGDTITAHLVSNSNFELITLILLCE